MNQNTINAYQRNAILTASPAELTLMLYDGAITFCNIAIMAIEKQDMEKAHVNLKKHRRLFLNSALHSIISIRCGKILTACMITFTDVLWKET